MSLKQKFQLTIVFLVLCISIFGQSEIASGTVRSSDSTPLSGIQVDLYGDGVETFITTSTGYYEFSVTYGFDYQIRLNIEHASYEPSGGYSFSLVEDEEYTGLDFTVYFMDDSNVTVRGRVTDGDGAPISGANIRCYKMSPYYEYSTVTNASGYYELRITDGYTYTLECFYLDYERDPVFYEITPAHGEVLEGMDFTLTASAEPDASISGTITISGEGSHAGIHVMASGITAEVSGWAVTDDAGNYEMSVFGGDSFRVYVEAPGYTIIPAERRIWVPVGGNATGNDFTLSEEVPGEAEISGYVRDSEMAPLDGMVVLCNSAVFSTETTTNSAGFYSFTVPTGSQYQVFPASEDYLFSPPNYILNPAPDDVLTGNDFIGHSISDTSVTVSGTVTQTGGVAFPGALIRLDIEDAGLFYSTTSDDAGFFSFRIIPGFLSRLYPDFPGYPVSPDEYTFTPSPGETITGRDFTVEVSGDANGTVNGFVSFEGGTPAEGFEVVISGPAIFLSMHTNSEGFYSFDVPGGETYDLTVTTEEYRPEPEGHTVAVIAEDTVSGVNFTLLHLEETDATISGYVRYPDMTPASGIDIMCSGAGYFSSQVTDGSGFYSFEVVSGRAYNVIPESEEHIFEPVNRFIHLGEGESSADNDFTAIEMSTTTATISGRVTNALGEGLEGATINASIVEPHYTFVTHSDVDGYYEIEVAHDFNYRVSCHYEDYMSEPGEYVENPSYGEILSGRDFTMFTPEDSYGYISGMAFLDGDPVAGAFINANGLFHGHHASAVTEADGSYLLSIAGNDSIILYASHEEYISIPANYRFWLSRGDTVDGYDFDFLIELPTGTISGTVTNSVGDPLSDIIVVCTGGEYMETLTDASGNYSFTVAAGVSYELNLSLSDSFHTSESYSGIIVEYGDELTGFDFTVLDCFSTDARISGTVTAEGGRLMEGARVQISNEFCFFSAETDASGNYEVNLPGGFEYSITVSAIGGLIPTPLYYSEFLPVSGNLTGIDFMLSETVPTDCYACGQILLDGAPASGVLVNAYNPHHSASAHTNSTGHYSIPIISGIPYNIQPSAIGFECDPLEYVVTLGTGDSACVYDFDLTSTPSEPTQICGNIWDMHETGFSGITVTAVNSITAATYTAVSSSDGSYCIDILTDGLYFLTVDPSYTSFPDTHTVGAVGGEPISDINFTVIPNNAFIRGTAELVSGAPAVGAIVQLIGTYGTDEVVIDGSGNFIFHTYGPASYMLSAILPGYIPEPDRVALELNEGDSLHAADFVFHELLEPDAVINGNVVFEGTTTPVVNATLTAYCDGPYRLEATTDEDGFYNFHVVGGYTYIVKGSFLGSSFTPDSIITTVASGSVNSGNDFAVSDEFLPNAFITGHVSTRAGEPLEGFRIIASIDIGDTILNFSTLTDDSGNYSLFLAGGSYYTVRCVQDGYSSDPREHIVLLIRGETTTDIDFIMEESTTATINGRVIYEGGTSAWGVTVTASGREVYHAETDAGGNYSFELPAPDTYTITCNVPGYRTMPPRQEFTVRVGETIGIMDFVLLDEGPTTEIHFDVGLSWNALSLPSVHPVAFGVDLDFLIPPLYVYNPETRIYDSVTEVSVGQGFWFLSREAAGFTVEVSEVATGLEMGLNRGWNLVGGPNSTYPVDFITDEPSIIPPIYKYDPARRVYIEATDIRPGFGYWILTAEDISISFE